MNVYIGIDQSMNSTGICILYYDGATKVKEQFFIVKPDKLTKKEKLANDAYLYFDYILYDKFDLSVIEDSHEKEYLKTLNMINAVNKIYDIISAPSVKGIHNENTIHIVMEGVSYGSKMRTVSIFDLAGLNYMIRQRILKHDDMMLAIVPPSEIKKFATGNGNCNKEAMIALFGATHPGFELPKLDDVADAYFMASYARHERTFKIPE